MIIGIPKEIKNNEQRVSITPTIVKTLVNANHVVLIQKDAGLGSGFLDKDYQAQGAKIVNNAKQAWDVDMVIKVKEPLEDEYQYFKKDLIIFTFLHLAAAKTLTGQLLKSQTTCFAYETLFLNNELPLLKPMSEIAGKRSIIVGAHFLEKSKQGKGLLLGGTTGTPPGNVLIIGGGVAGKAAAKNAVGLGANVTILELNDDRINTLDNFFKGKATILKSSPDNLTKLVPEADLLVSTILIPGKKAIKVVSKEMVHQMSPGSVVIDIAIDQGGSIETIDRITTIDQPIFTVNGIVHYAVANIPGEVPLTSTMALTNVTGAYILAIANNGMKAIKNHPELGSALNIYQGKVVNKQVADSLDLSYHQFEQ